MFSIGGETMLKQQSHQQPPTLTSPPLHSTSAKIPINSKEASSHNSWLLRFFESKHFDMSIAISYLFNTKEPGVQTYLCNRLFTFSNPQVDFYLPQLLNIYVYCCTDTGGGGGNDQFIADLLNTYFRTRCACRASGIDFSLRCSWLLDAHINDNAKLATQTSKESKRVKRGLNNAIKLYKQITSEKLRPSLSGSGGGQHQHHDMTNGGTTTTNASMTTLSGSNTNNTNNNNGSSNGPTIITSSVTEESSHDVVADDEANKTNGYHDISSDEANTE